MKKVKDENKTEAKKKESIKPEENPVIVLSKEEKEHPFGETIEQERKGIFTLYKKTSRYSTFIMLGVVAMFIVAFIVYAQPGWGQPVCWSLVGVTLVGLICYYIFTKNLYPNASKKYFGIFWKETNDFLFNAPEFSECTINTKERYVLPEVITDRVYKNVIDSASRNLVRGLYNGEGFTFGELAYYIPGQKKNQKAVLFVGRHLSIENNLHFEGRYIINIRGENPTDLPNDTEDLKELSSQNKFVIYGPEGANFEKDLGKAFINNLKTIDCSGHLLNVNVSVMPGRTTVYFSYDDVVAAIPFDKEIDLLL